MKNILTIAGKILCPSCFEEQVTDSDICGVCGFNGSAVFENMGALPIGTVLQDRYILGKSLGKGGFGITYLAFDKAGAQKVAVKEYFPDSLSYRAPGTSTISSYTGDKADYFTSGAEKFYGEAKILSRFNGNEHIINVLDFFYANNTAYYVMEYIDGIDLKKYIAMKGGRLPYTEAIDVMIPVMYALIIVHSLDILHRDISPDNIYLTKNGDIKLLDFGAARQVYAEQSNSLSVILKQGYTPVEQYRKRGNHGPWSDIYSLGATVYYALTGIVPEESINRLENDDLKMPSELGVPVPLDFEMILRKMMAVKPEDRYQSVIELKEAMRNLGAITASKPGPVSKRITKKDEKKKPVGKIILAITAGMLGMFIILAVISSVIYGTKDVTDKPYTLITAAFRVDCKYTGKWSNDAPNGEGVLTVLEAVPNYWEQGVKLTGTFADGLLQGEGTQEDPDGSIYKGGFKNGLRSGQGTYTIANGEKYIGEYKNHYLNGKGTAVYTDGSVYEGDFAGGYCSGQGKYKYSDGSVYEGGFSNDKENGYGTYTSSAGWIYKGDFTDGNFNGNGVLYDTDGSVAYDGQWKDGKPTDPIPKRNVTNTSYNYSPDGFSIPCSYTGEWENAMPNGQGTLVVTEDGNKDTYYWYKGDTYTGAFVDGLLEGSGTYVCVKGSKYVGNFARGLFNGKGVYTSSDGYAYTGDFVDESFSGQGVVIWDNGSRYEGGFANGVFSGEGSYWDETGELVFSGQWENGNPVLGE